MKVSAMLSSLFTMSEFTPWFRLAPPPSPTPVASSPLSSVHSVTPMGLMNGGWWLLPLVLAAIASGVAIAAGAFLLRHR